VHFFVYCELRLVPLAEAFSLLVIQPIHLPLNVLLFDNHFCLLDFVLSFTEFFGLSSILLNEIRETCTLGCNFGVPLLIVYFPLINLDFFLLKFNRAAPVLLLSALDHLCLPFVCVDIFQSLAVLLFGLRLNFLTNF
jgi:hypothetical protein